MNDTTSRRKIWKDTLINRIFHRRELQEQQSRRVLTQRLIEDADRFLDELETCSELHGLLNIHRQAWKAGLTSKRLGPNEYGMFRTENIAEMKPEEVYLGDIYGLWTYNIPQWERQKHHKYGSNNSGIDPDTTVYQLVVRQYKSLLMSELKTVRKEQVELSQALQP